jgi:hypothetical protein
MSTRFWAISTYGNSYVSGTIWKQAMPMLQFPLSNTPTEQQGNQVASEEVIIARILQIKV